LVQTYDYNFWGNNYVGVARLKDVAPNERVPFLEHSDLTALDQSFVFNMAKKSLIKLNISSIGATAGAIALLASCPSSIQAQQRDSQLFSFAQLPQLPDRGAPSGRRRGGTSRDDCPVLNTPLTALVPGKEMTGDIFNSTSLMASTVAEYPTFWVYVPKMPEKLRSGEFILQNEAGEDIYRTELTLPQKAGAIAITLPSNSQYSLKSDRKYHWYFKVFCSSERLEAGYVYVDAWIERVALSNKLKNQLQTTSKSQHYRVYLENNIWYDALTSLGKLLKHNPQNDSLKQDWGELLSSIGLSDLIREPIVMKKES
jgi:Domain of Unknown Function (DUF928)